ncbi:hypothetical protein [Saccharopolyspora sp. NPDC002686]|uniref:hypothetical protein n=1 Tax=Saccharopolyspora sp. NPDC002686 TaxID=3154541 RepID=UPI00331A9A04
METSAEGGGLTSFHPLTGAALIESGAQTFHIQPDQLPRVLAGLDEVRAKYEDVYNAASRLSVTGPPFWDDATVNEIKRICQRARGGEGNLHDFARGLADWVLGFRDAVQRAIQDHQRIDEESSMG